MVTYEVICSFLLLSVIFFVDLKTNKQIENIQAAMPQSKNNCEAAVLNR